MGSWPSPDHGRRRLFGANPNNPPSVSNYDLAASVQLHSLTLNQGGGCQGNFAITGGSIGLQSGGSITANWNNAGVNPDTLPGISLNGPATFTRGPSGGAGANTQSFNSAVAGTGPLTVVNNAENDKLRLDTANSYSGATTIAGSGRVLAAVNGAIPTGSALTVNGSVLFQAASTIGSLAGGGNVFMNGSNTLTAGGDNSSTTFSGVYQNSGGAAALTKAGTGALTLSGANTYTGATAVNAGKLPVNGSLAAASVVTVNNTATLGGIGTVGAVTVNSGGTLAPGASPGIINTGNLSLTSGSALEIELNGTMVGTQYDQVNVTGTVNLGGGNLDVGLGFVPPDGFTFIIINNDDADAVTGTFAGLPEGATFTVSGTKFRISYKGGDGNDVTLTSCTPILTCPSDIVVPNTTGMCGANVSFTAPTSSCGDVATCLPAPGSFFQVGMTTVTCTVMGGPSCSFKVTVNDTQAPTITCPASVTTSASATCPVSTNSAPVNLTVTASDNCPGVTTSCAPSSGSIFPVGTTTVTCKATDAAGNMATCSFTVTSFSFCLQDETNPGNVVLVNAQTGDFTFCCGGIQIASGRGTLTTRGCIGSIDGTKGDRQVHIQWDTSANNGAGEGTAYVQKLSNKIVCQITDKNMSNNTCQCSNPPPPMNPKKPPKERTF